MAGIRINGLDRIGKDRLGTLLSGWTYQIGGLVGRLTTATLMVGVSVLAVIRLKSGYEPQVVS
ncbi:MAG: hypothetical protein P8O70_06150 [SAR324 cluster bacterium]|nr:hypothetical protein [SAR324 cluster bacterium]